jgi:hypothetical protein
MFEYFPKHFVFKLLLLFMFHNNVKQLIRSANFISPACIMFTYLLVCA